MNGFGKITKPGFYQYEGNFKDGKFEGKGLIRYFNGSVFKGNFENGNKEGFGEFSFSHATFHKGFYKDNKAVGKSVMRFYMSVPPTFYDNP